MSAPPEEVLNQPLGKEEAARRHGRGTPVVLARIHGLDARGTAVPPIKRSERDNTNNAPPAGVSTMATQQKKLGEILVDLGIITPKEVSKALEHAKVKKMRMGEALVDLKLCTEANVYKALAAQHSMEYIDLDKSSV